MKEKFNYYRALTRKINFNQKKSYYSNILNNNMQNPRQVWSILNELIYNKSKKNSMDLILLKREGKIINDQKEIAI